MKFHPRTAHPTFGKPDYISASPSVTSVASVVKSAVFPLRSLFHSGRVYSYTQSFIEKPLAASQSHAPLSIFRMNTYGKRVRNFFGMNTSKIAQNNSLWNQHLQKHTGSTSSLRAEARGLLALRPAIPALDMDTAPLSRHNLDGVRPPSRVGPLSQEGE